MKNLTLAFVSVLFLWTGLGCSENPTQQPMDLLVGTYTGSGSEGIYLLSFNPAKGTLSDPRLAVAITNPSYLTISEDRRLVYSVGEGDSGIISAFNWKEGSDSLRLVDQVSAQGAGPCYIDYGDEEQVIAVANYVTGNGAFYSAKDDGSLSDPVTFQHQGSGPNQDRQEAPHAHCSVFSRDSRFVYVVDLGIDKVKGYAVDAIKEATDTAAIAGFTAFDLQPGDGPRHLVFHPDRDLAFIINELSNTVVSVGIDPETGKFDQVDRLSTLPEDFNEHSQCADIHITSDGKFLYASNRGHNSIAIFSVSENGQLERIGTEPVRGNWPRNFTFSPDEKYLLVANQESDNITVFSRDAETGKLSYTGNEIKISKPVCLKF